MRIIFSIITLCFMAQAQKRFNSDYFISKHNLNLPIVTKEMFDVSELTHVSDLWNYFYHGNTEKLDSVTRKLTIQGFDPSRKILRYNYISDSIYVREISISDVNNDTLVNMINFYKNNFRFKEALDLQNNCIWRSSFDERGIKMLDVSKCPRDTGFDGQVFYLDKKEEYLEKYRYKNGKIDSNSIRWYYLTPFDSIVSDFIVMKGKNPIIVSLNIYNNQRKKQYSYDFGIYGNNNEVTNFNYYTYTDKDQPHRVYCFFVKDRDAKKKCYELVNYTEYEYDSLGRKIRGTTRVKPDPKEPESKDGEK